MFLYSGELQDLGKNNAYLVFCADIIGNLVDLVELNGRDEK